MILVKLSFENGALIFSPHPKVRSFMRTSPSHPPYPFHLSLSLSFLRAPPPPLHYPEQNRTKTSSSRPNSYIDFSPSSLAPRRGSTPACLPASPPTSAFCGERRTDGRTDGRTLPWAHHRSCCCCCCALSLPFLRRLREGGHDLRTTVYCRGRLRHRRRRRDPH